MRSKTVQSLCLALVCATTSQAIAEDSAVKNNRASQTQFNQSFKSFTGKVLGSHVRLRTDADVDSQIVKELNKDELLVIVGEKNDFYAVEPPKDTKAYVFRSFVIDDAIEGTRVNVRLAPELDAPVIGHLNTGDKVNGTISSQNSKWLAIEPPSTSKFYIAKEFVDHVGGPEYKAIHDRKQEAVIQLVESANLNMQSELRKPFEEISIEQISSNYQTVINDYQEFPQYVEEAKEKLAALQEAYLQKKLAYLEAKTSQMDKASHFDGSASYAKTQVATNHEEEKFSPTDRMKVWEPVERSLYLSWANMNHAKNMTDFYQEQQMNSTVISGILESYAEPVKKKPGDYILREKGLPVAYVYSTQINLHNYVGKQVNLVAAPRPNNNFAFPAYYVLEVEHQ